LCDQFPFGCRPETDPSKTTRPALVERISRELQDLWERMLERGRTLEPDEFPDDLKARLAKANVSCERATGICLSDHFPQEVLASAAALRREDYLVHFALTIFPGSPRYASLPRSIQRDVRALFGSHAAALEEARELLFSAGKLAAVISAVDAAEAAGLGARRDSATFRFHAPALTRLPAILRVLVGSAGLLRGGVDGADFVDIKLQRPAASFISCTDPAARLPVVAERTRVDLGRLRATVERPDGMVLYLKGRFLLPEDPDRDEQLAFDRKLLSSGLVSEDGRGPRFPELRDWLSKKRTAAANPHPGASES
jgi:DNA phosphorothioation-associated putative methyltransferase